MKISVDYLGISLFFNQKNFYCYFLIKLGWLQILKTQITNNQKLKK